MNFAPHFLDYTFIFIILMCLGNFTLQFYSRYVKIRYPVETDKLDSDKLVDAYVKLLNVNRRK